MFDNICIIGCGLIGSSILRAVKIKKLSKKTVVVDKSRDVLSYIKEKKLSDETTNDPRVAVKDSDFIIISTPLSAYKEVFLSIKDDIKKNVIITDTGSSKKEINKIIENFNFSDLSWIASHPIAGTEESGPAAGQKDLFHNRWNIISPSTNAKKEHIEKVKKFWEELGCKVKQMSFEEHDKILSITSHLPHAIAYIIVKTAIERDEKMKEEVIKYSAGGLRDFTRIASSNPLMWRDIFIDNSENVINVLDEFSKNIENFKKFIQQKNGDELLKLFSSTKNIRKEIIRAGQETDKPDFGRKKN
tara:strand:- start:527 stop:1432 length:906 start_codon:yes stop_codon:yes gene_type:complete